MNYRTRGLPRGSLLKTLSMLVCLAPLLFASLPAAAQTTVADIDQWQGRYGVGWSGMRIIPLHPNGDPRELRAPTLGVRHWQSATRGIDAGVGVHISAGSRSIRDGDTSTSTTEPTRLGLLLHGGVPMVLSTSAHTAFLFVPQASLGFGTSTRRPGGDAQPVHTRGVVLGLGATAGIELFFGFIGLPQLSLDANVGLFLEASSGNISQGTQRNRVTAVDLSTAVGANPWDILRAQVTGRYYF